MAEVFPIIFVEAGKLYRFLSVFKWDPGLNLWRSMPLCTVTTLAWFFIFPITTSLILSETQIIFFMAWWLYFHWDKEFVFNGKSTLRLNTNSDGFPKEFDNTAIPWEMEEWRCMISICIFLHTFFNCQAVAISSEFLNGREKYSQFWALAYASKEESFLQAMMGFIPFFSASSKRYAICCSPPRQVLSELKCNMFKMMKLFLYS